MPTTDRDAQALAYLAGRLRDETRGARKWDQVGIYEIIKAELVGKNLAHAVESILCHGTDPDAKTPGSLRRPFLPPKPSDKPGEHPHPLPRAEQCRRCGGARGNCHCTREARAVEYDDEPVAEPLTQDEALARMRADIAGAKGARS